jgi:hypothetical protein
MARSLYFTELPVNLDLSDAVRGAQGFDFKVNSRLDIQLSDN